MSQSANVCKSFLIHALEVNDVFFFFYWKYAFLINYNRNGSVSEERQSIFIKSNVNWMSCTKLLKCAV